MINDPGNAATASEPRPDPYTPERGPLDSLLATIVTAVALFTIVVGWINTRDYLWAVYGVTGWLSAMLVVFGISTYLNPKQRRRGK